MLNMKYHFPILPQLWVTTYVSKLFPNAWQIQQSCHWRIHEFCSISKWFQKPCHRGFRNPAIGIFRKSDKLVNSFQMPVGFRNPATYKKFFFSTTVKGWNTLSFVTNISFLDKIGSINKMDAPAFVMKLFARKVSSFTIVRRSCILGDAGFKISDYLTYLETEKSNTKILCRFALISIRH